MIGFDAMEATELSLAHARLRLIQFAGLVRPIREPHDLNDQQPVVASGFDAQLRLGCRWGAMCRDWLAVETDPRLPAGDRRK